MSGLDPDIANGVWDLLVAEAGALERDRESFVRYLSASDFFPTHEYRFMGTLGFGGKLSYNDWRGARISCYPENLTPEREALIERLNLRLAEMVPCRSRS